MTATTHPFTSTDQMDDPTPRDDTYGHVQAAKGRLDDGTPVVGFLPTTRPLPSGYTVTADHQRIVDGETEAVEVPFEIARSITLPELKTADEIREELTESTPDWLPRELAAGRFADTDGSWLDAWQSHRQDLADLRED